MRYTVLALLMLCSAAIADEVKIVVVDAAGEPETTNEGQGPL